MKFCNKDIAKTASNLDELPGECHRSVKIWLLKTCNQDTSKIVKTCFKLQICCHNFSLLI